MIPKLNTNSISSLLSHVVENAKVPDFERLVKSDAFFEHSKELTKSYLRRNSTTLSTETVINTDGYHAIIEELPFAIVFKYPVNGSVLRNQFGWQLNRIYDINFVIAQCLILQCDEFIGWGNPKGGSSNMFTAPWNGGTGLNADGLRVAILENKKKRNSCSMKKYLNGELILLTSKFGLVDDHILLPLINNSISVLPEVQELVF